MRTALIVAGATLLTCCSTRAEREHNAIMDRIEKNVQLPKGAPRLDQFARFYLDAGKGHIVAVYVPPALIEKDAAGECEELTSTNGDSKDVPCVSKQVRKVKAGQRLWLSKWTELPGPNAPRCQVVIVEFDQPRGRFDDVSRLSDHALE